MAKIDIIPVKIRRRVLEWILGPIDEKTREEIIFLLDTNPDQLINQFASDLPYRNGAFYGRIAVGTHCLNIYTIEKIAAAFAVVFKRYNKEGVIAVGYDFHPKGKMFAMIMLNVLIAQGVEAEVVEEFFKKIPDYRGGIFVALDKDPHIELFALQGKPISEEIQREIQRELEKRSYFDSLS